MKSDLQQLFPADMRPFWSHILEIDGLQEIRLRTDKPAAVLIEGKEFFVGKGGMLTKLWQDAYLPGRREIEGLLNHICHYSPYAYEDELRQGYLTVEGGHRVGIAGQVVLENDIAFALSKIVPTSISGYLIKSKGQETVDCLSCMRVRKSKMC